jgi:selenide,water dikinase
VPAALVALAHDPQTSGGLLATVKADQADAIAAVLETSGVPCWPVGRVEASKEPGVSLVA